MGKGEKGGVFFSSGGGYRSHNTIVVRRYYGPYYRRTYGYGSYEAATGDCACGCGPLHFLCCIATVWLILMMCLTFSTAPKAQSSDELYLEVAETRPYTLKGSAAFVSGKHEVTDRIGNTRFYQSSSLPPLSGSVLQPVPIPNRSIPSDDWRWEGYWLNAGSTAVYTATCTRAVDFAIVEGDSNMAKWEENFGGSSYTATYVYGQTSFSNSYGPSTYDQNVYWILANTYSFVSTCTIRLNITYTTYDTTQMTLKLTGSGTLDAADGPVVMVPPNVPDPRNVYVGPNDFTVGADMYTIKLKQKLQPGAEAGPMMGIFAGVCVLFCIIGVCLVNGLPECLGGDPNAGVGSSTEGQSPAAAAAVSAVPPAASAPAPSSSANTTASPYGGAAKPEYPTSGPTTSPVATGGPAAPVVIGAQYGQQPYSQPPAYGSPAPVYHTGMGGLAMAVGQPQPYNPNAQPQPMMQPMQPVYVVPVEGQPQHNQQQPVYAPPPAYSN